MDCLKVCLRSISSGNTFPGARNSGKCRFSGRNPAKGNVYLSYQQLEKRSEPRTRKRSKWLASVPRTWKRWRDVQGPGLITIEQGADASSHDMCYSTCPTPFIFSNTLYRPCVPRSSQPREMAAV